MNQIKIKEIKISNFGGVANATYNFDDETTIVRGKFGSGKSSAYFAYLWALGFNIPSWEPMIEGYRLLKVKTEAFVTLDVDGVKYVIGKTNEPKYKANKFTGEEEYTGTSFAYWFDEQQLEATVYKNKIAELFGVDYFTLELLSNLSLFNNDDGKRWDKVERRKFLFKLFDLDGKIAELSSLPDFEPLKEWLEKGNDEIAINQILNKRKTDIDNEIKTSNVIIQEKMKEMQDYSVFNFEALEQEKKKLAEEVESIEKNSFGENLNRMSEEKQKELQELTFKQLEEQSKIRDQEFDLNMRKLGFEKELREIEDTLSYCQEKLDKANDKGLELVTLREDLEVLSFSEEDKNCPMCKQKLPEDVLAERLANFEKDKLNKINQYDIEIRENNDARIDLEKKIAELSQQKSVKEGQIDFITGEQIRIDYSKYNEITIKIEEVKAEIEKLKDIDSNQTVADKKQELKTQYEEVLIKLSKKEELEKAQAKINELKDRVRSLGVLDAERINQKQALQKYIQAKVALVNESVNNSFEGVKYNFFHWLAAGNAKDFESICEAVLIENGCEYDSLSSGQRVKADLFTNKSLRKILGVKFPQFVDDTVLFGFKDGNIENNEWQTIYLVTDNSVKPPITLISEVYSLKDCDIRK